MSTGIFSSTKFSMVQPLTSYGNSWNTLLLNMLALVSSPGMQNACMNEVVTVLW